jgi:hypothetical protein
LVVWNRERDILEVVNSRATDEDGFFQGSYRESRRPARATSDYPRSKLRRGINWFCGRREGSADG